MIGVKSNASQLLNWFLSIKLINYQLDHEYEIPEKLFTNIDFVLGYVFRNCDKLYLNRSYPIKIID
jgi:hypothetical protein